MVKKRNPNSYNRMQSRLKNEFDVSYNISPYVLSYLEDEENLESTNNEEYDTDNIKESIKGDTKIKYKPYKNSDKKNILSRSKKYLKKDIITAILALKSGIPQKVIGDILLDYTEMIVEYLLKGSLIKINGLCNFKKTEDGKLIVELNDKLIKKLKEQKKFNEKEQKRKEKERKEKERKNKEKEEKKAKKRKKEEKLEEDDP